MNYLFGEIHKEGFASQHIELEEDVYVNEKLKFTIHRENQSGSVIKRDNIILGMMGDIYEDQERELEYIYNKYCNEGIEGLKALNGFFTIVVIDLKANEVYILQDARTSLEHVYFCQNNDVLYISSSMEELICNSGIKREVNTEILPTYLHYSFTPGNETLLKNVFKLASNSCLKYNLDNDMLSVLKIPHNTKRNLNGNSLIQIIDDCIKNRMDITKKLGFSLSGGFDSNLLFSRAINFMKDSEINAFSYGYDSPKSELKNVERIIELYKKKGYRISHYKYNAKAEDIYKLPQIVSFLQEPILEPGLIFHYGMAEMIKKNNIDILLGGDCNDQVYDKRLYFDMISKMQEPLNLENYPVYGRLRLGEFDRIHTYKYFTDIETEWLLNKDISFNVLKLRLEVYSDVFTNYFMLKRFFVRESNVSVRLPFLDAGYTYYINSNLEIEDLPFKKNHIDLCKKYIPNDVYSELINATEASSPYSYLFLENDFIRKEIFSLIKSSETAAEFFNMDSINQLLNNFEFALKNGRESKTYYKASILSCRIFAVLGFIVWHNIYINKKEANKSLFDVLSN